MQGDDKDFFKFKVGSQEVRDLIIYDKYSSLQPE